ncbi:hypothetical protein C5B96_13515 [Subtercola sp. Z020]|uniref:hypothetical protein n=1 Tax=Subtercola sp. Z020 TaxID=2080582 RepID=UPI000CE7E78E|nr:hypothetical protein [Subtercola sp. Z020]PPF79059.1 hypothetical protein C5B96_13515 [Subtercola sp. Z020]
MTAARLNSALQRVLTWVYVGFAAAIFVAGIVKLLNGDNIGWLLLLFAPITVLIGHVRVARIRAQRAKPSELP